MAELGRRVASSLQSRCILLNEHKRVFTIKLDADSSRSPLRTVRFGIHATGGEESKERWLKFGKRGERDFSCL